MKEPRGLALLLQFQYNSIFGYYIKTQTMESLQLCSQPHLTLAPELKKPYAGAEGSWHPLAICGEDLGPAQVWPAQAS